MVMLERPKTTEPPVSATIEALASSALTTDTATTSNPSMAADAPTLATKKFS